MLPSIIAKLTKIKDPVPQELKDMEKDLKGKNVEVVTRRRGWGASLDEAFSEDGYETTSEKLDNKNPPKEKVEKNVFDDLNKEPNSIQEKTALTGPIGELLGFGVPSMIGYHRARGKGEKAFDEGKKLEDRTNILKGLFIPGHLGGRLGFERGHAEGYFKHHPELVDKDPVLDPYFENHTTGDIKDLYQHNREIWKQERKEHNLKQIARRGSWESEDDGDYDENNENEYMREGERRFNKQFHKHAFLLYDKYPVDTYEQIVKAASYWREHYKEFTPEERKEYCENLSEKMATCLLPVPKDIQKYASKTYALDTELNVNSRKNYVPEEYHEVLDNLIEKIGQVTPQTYSNALKAFDDMFNLDKHYDVTLNDYIASTFGPEKIAQDDSWRYSYNEVHIGEEHLNSLKNEFYALKRMIGEDKAEQFIQHPKKTFETLDKDHKYIIGRLAMQTWSRGGNLHE